MRNEMNKAQKYTDAWEAFNAHNDEETAQARENLRFTNINRGGAPKISTFGMCLSGAFSKGAMEIFTRLAKEKFPDPPTPDNPPGTFSYLMADGTPQRFLRLVDANLSAKHTQLRGEIYNVRNQNLQSHCSNSFTNGPCS